MTFSSRAARGYAGAVLVLLAIGTPAFAQANLTWDPNGAAAGTGGAGTWNTTTASWFNGTTHGPWSAVTFDNATFDGTAGAVTLGVAVRAHNLTFNTTGYTVTGSTLTLGGTTPTITTNAALATIGSVVAGTAGLTTAGPGTLILSGNNTFTGGTTIGGGTLQVGNGGTTGVLGTGNITNDAALVVNRSNAVTFGQAMSGTGTLTQAGAGTTTLTGANTYSGATTISAGILQVGSGGTTGTLGSGAVTNNAALRINRSDALTVANDIDGTGTLTKLGAGTTTLTGTNTYSGTTTITTGTLQVGAGGTTGTLGSGAIANSAALRVNRSDAYTLGQNISGSGTLTQFGAGTTTLTGTNTYSGVTTISAGTLQVGNGGTTGSLGTGAVSNNSVLEINRNNAVTIGQVISGTGSLRQVGTGTTTVTANNTYSGGTTISAGTLQVGIGGTAGALGAGNITNNAALVINRSNAVTFGQAIDGAGTLTKLGAGTTTLTGANTYSGATTISAGILQVGSGGTTGTLGSGAVTNNAALRINRSDALTVDNDIDGTGTLTKLGAGTTTLTGTNTYSGTTTITTGTLQVGAGGTTGTLGSGAIANSAALRVNRSDAYTLGQNISGSGTLTQFGAGTTTLTGTNTYSGVTTISAGTLQVGNGGTTGSLGTGAVSNNSVLEINRNNAVTIGQVISGTGSLRQVGTGTTTVTANNTYSGGTTISAGTLQVGIGGTAGALGAGNITNNAALVINRSNAVTFGQAIDGAGTLTKLGAGTTTLTGANTYSGATTISAGILQVGSGGTTGTLGSGAVTNNAALRINRSDALTVDNDIDGTGTLTKLGAGTTTLTGANSYSGTTTISAGTLQVGAGGTTGTLGSGNVTNNAALRINRSDAYTLGQNISGSGSLSQFGAGTTTLTGTNTYSGVTTISAGTLQVGNGGTTGSLGTGAVTNNSILDVNRNNALTIGQVISGTGSVTQSGAGTTTLTGTNTYSGGTTISAGTLQVGSGGTTGALGTGNVTNDAALVINRSNAVTFGQVISGSGTLAKLGAGTTSLTGDNTYSGTTTISAGILEVGAGGTTGTIGSGAIINNAALRINRSDAVTLGQDISGTGTLTKLAAGTTTLTGTNSYTGTTTISAGILEVGAGGTTGTLGSGNITNNAALRINRSDALTLGQNITGSGTLTQFGAGTTTLTGTNTYSGVTTISAGTLQVGNGGTTGSLGNGAITNNAALIVNRSNAITFGQVMSGTGTLTKLGAGTMTLTGANTYSGTTTISAGVLQVGNGGTAGTLGSGAVVNDAGLIFNRSNATTIANNISGTGTVTKMGAGITTLTGTSTYTGATSVNAGTLRVNGSLGNTATTVASGATLGGSGTIAGSVTVNSSGRLAPGNSPGTLTVGSLNLMPGAFMDYEFGTPGIIGGGVNDLIEVNGDVTLDGTLNVSALAGFGIGSYRLMNYTGSLFNNVLDFGLMPSGYAFQLQTAVAGRLSLLVGSSTAGPVQYWDGTNTVGDNVVSGGSGTWTAGPTNWTLADGSFNLGWGGQTAVFAGAPGTVSVVGPVSFNGLQFQTNGYTIAAGSGGVLNTSTADTPIISSPDVVSTIDAPIAGSGGISVQGWGTLIFRGENTYTGGTTIGSGSTLQIGDGGTSGSILGNVNNDGALVFNRADTIAFGDDISGAGMLRQAGAGTLILTGTNSYTGGTWIGGGSTLQIGDGGLTGSIVGNVVNDGTLAFKRANTIIFGGDVSGSGALRQDGAGTLVLTGTSTYSGGTTIASGSTLQLGNGGTSGSIIGDVANGGALVFNRANTIGFGGRVSGSGEVRQEGNGTVVLSGVNSYSGGTSIHAGTLSISSDENLGSGDLYIHGGALQTTATFSSGRSTTLGSRGGAFYTNGSTNFNLTGIISGPGALTKIGGGTLTLGGVNTYSGGTTLTAGTLSISRDANLGAFSGSVTFDGGTLQTTADMTSSRTMSLESSGTIETANGSTFLLQSGMTGIGTLNKSGNGRLVLAADNTYRGDTNVRSGVLQLGNCGTSGSIVGDARVDGVLAVSRSDSYTFDGAMSGNGGLVKDCTGTTIVNGANTYAGGTLVNAGVLQGSTKSLQGEIVNDAELVFDQVFDGTFSGTLFGAGTMAKRGSGAVSFAGNHGLTGRTTIEAGTLALNGTMVGAVSVLRDGTFDAAGVIGGSLSVDGRVNVLPTASGDFGVLGVAGNATFRAESTYGVSLNAAGQNSALVANGNAGVQGATIAVTAAPGAYGRVTQYAVMRGEGGLSGIASATSSSPALEPLVSKNDTTLFVTLLNREVPLQLFAITGNGSRIAGALDRLKGTESAHLADVTRELTALDDRTLAISLDAMSGEIHASAVQLAAIDGESATDAIRSEVTTRMSQRNAETASGTAWGYDGARSWFRFRGERNSFDSIGERDGLFGARGATGSIQGFAMGRDWTKAGNWLFGVGGSFATGRMALSGLSDSTTFSSPRGMAYAGYAWKRWAVDGGVAVARAAYQTTRTLQFYALAPAGGRLLDGIASTAVSRPSGIAAEAWSEMRFDLRLGSWKVQPAAGLRRASYGLSEYTETGADSLSLSAPARSINSLQADMGVRLSRAMGSLRPYLGAVVRRELTSGRTAAGLSLANDPTGSFEVDGLRLSQHSTIGQAGLLLQTRGVGLSLMYEARGNSAQVRQTIQLGIGF